MLKPKVTHNVICKDTKLASFLRQNLGEFYNEFVYNYDVCVRDRENIKLFVPFILNKYAYQLLVVCKEYFIICGNPPSMIDIKISYEDLVELKIVSLFMIEIYYSSFSYYHSHLSHTRSYTIECV